MIPISADSLMEYEDKESGVVYIFRPLLGDSEIAFYSALDAIAPSVDHKPFIADATKAIEESNPGKEWDKDERAQAIRAEAQRMASAGRRRNANEMKNEAEALDGLINKVLVGWKSTREGITLPAFPDKNSAAGPSSLFKIRDKSKLFEIIMNLNSTLSEGERKNS